MRNSKKFLALVLAMLMVSSASAAVSAFDDVDEDGVYADAIDDLVDKGVITGFSADEFKPDANVTRWQFALMMVKAYTGITDSADWDKGVAIFDDVAAGQYAGAIAKAVSAGIIKGRTADAFDPTADVNYSEALTMAVRALGFETKDKDGAVNMTYPTDYLAKAMELGLTDGLDISDKYQALTRAETAQIIYNIIYADRYSADDKELPTFAEANFDEAGLTNVTTFVVTSTVKQALENTTDTLDADDEAVALTKLDENGNFGTDPIFVTCEDLGIDADEIENYIGLTVDLVNYNAKKQTFAKAIFAETSEVLNNSVTVSDPSVANEYTKVKIGNKTYYVVNEYKGDTIKNELLLFNGAKGLEAVSYDDAKDVLTGNYKLVLFDNDKDGIADRAVFYPVYVSVFNTITDGKDKTAGAWDADTKNTYVLPKDADELAKGDVFTYTYNFETDTVYVIDTLEATTGLLQKVDGSKKDSASDKYVVKLTIDGDVYTLDSANRQGLGLTVGNLKSTTFGGYTYISGKDAGGSAVTPSIGYASYSDVQGLVGKNVTFYVNDNDEVLYAYATPGVSLTTTYAVVSKAVTYDSNAIYVNLYLDGALTKNVKVVKIGDKKVSSYSDDQDLFGMNELLTLFKSGESYAPGTKVKVAKNTDGTYNMSLPTTGTASTDDLVTYTGATNIKFKSGIGDQDDNGVLADKDMIRTTANTEFYFINTTTKDISKFVGKPADGDKIVMAAGITVYADKLGYGSAAPKAGESSVVIVEYTTATKANITGFGGAVNTVAATNTVFIASGLTLTTDNRVLGSELGFTGDNADKVFYVYSNDNLAINMNTGAIVTKVYSTTPISSGNLYKIDSNAIVTEAGTATTKTFTGADAFTAGRYWTVAGIAETITNVYVTYDNAISIKTSEADIDALIGAGAFNASYIFTDGKLVVVLDTTANATISVEVTGNALAADTTAVVKLTFGAYTMTKTISALGTYTFTDAPSVTPDTVTVVYNGNTYTSTQTSSPYTVTIG